jgi:hypothetical protein
LHLGAPDLLIVLLFAVPQAELGVLHCSTRISPTCVAYSAVGVGLASPDFRSNASNSFRESRRPAFQNVEQRRLIGVFRGTTKTGGHAMSFGRGLLLWLLGIPLPIIILLATIMHH